MNTNLKINQYRLNRSCK